jgi:hypothetical protein
MHARQDICAVVLVLVVERHRTLDHVGAPARARKLLYVRVDVPEEGVVTLMRVFGVVGVRHQVGIPVGPEGAVDESSRLMVVVVLRAFSSCLIFFPLLFLEALIVDRKGVC